VRYLRKFYPWYIARMEPAAAERKALIARAQEAQTLAHARALLGVSGPDATAERAAGEALSAA
jgi:hypothetical protein